MVSCMSRAFLILLSISLILSLPLLASWGSNVMSADAVNHWRVQNQIAHVQGIITQVIDSEGFRLTDDTGNLDVFLSNNNFHFHTGERVEVKGKLIQKQHNILFEATAIKGLS